MTDHTQEELKALLLQKLDTFTHQELNVIHRILERRHITRNTNQEFEEQLTLGQRLADKMAAFGGSWTFIDIFVSILVAWVILNSVILARGNAAFDPFPYILLNLFLSMIAATQAPVITRREGLVNTAQAAVNRLDQPMALGYSSAGTIVALGKNMQGFKVGQRVACAGGGYAVHAEYNVVPRNLLTLLPKNVDFESAAFTTLGAIALHGFRLAEPQIGENVAVIGLGLLGLLTIQIASAAGCSVMGIDLDPRRIALASSLGLEAVTRPKAESASAAFTANRGFDVILICADTPIAPKPHPPSLSRATARSPRHSSLQQAAEYPGEGE